ncbi:YceI family protein [Streptomyces sp. 8N616]|uniref:YceI family protein n=1 Tax=Streptomyces sp. 8N616 TaxID=3457414 RepID=UPI003FD139E9
MQATVAPPCDGGPRRPTRGVRVRRKRLVVGKAGVRASWWAQPGGRPLVRSLAHRRPELVAWTSSARVHRLINVAVAAGTYELGPRTGRILLRTLREGLVAKAGHDLVIEATQWEGTLTVPADPTAPTELSVRVDMDALRVREGTGGVKALTDADRRQIEQTMHDVLHVDDHPHTVYTSTNVEIEDRSAMVDGQLTLAGQTHPLRLVVRQREDDTLGAAASVVQSHWGVRPYSGFFGALKLRDAVEIEVTLRLPEGALTA